MAGESGGVVIGVTSDTHTTDGEGLAPGLLAVLTGVDLILHAGDLTSADVLAELGALAPVVAVRGNCDRLWQLPPFRRLDLPGGRQLLLLHDLDQLSADLARGAAVVVTGHTHVPEIREDGGVLWLNPGSPRSPRGGHAPGILRLRATAVGIAAERVLLPV